MFVYVNKYCNKILMLLTLNNEIKPLIKWGSDPVKRGRNGSGRSWCVAKDVGKDKLQSCLDYACGEGRADCCAVQPGATCYVPNTLEAHASFAFNSYYQKMERAASVCDFDGATYIITEQPSQMGSTQADPAPVGCAVAVVNEALSVYLKNQRAIDVKKEQEKLNAKFAELQKQKDSLNKVMSAKGYEEKVPAHIKEENVAKLASLMQQLLSIDEATQHIERQVAANSEVYV